MHEIESVGQLSDDELMMLLERCVRDERELSSRLLVHMSEVDSRGLFRGAGFSSMFDYTVRALHMSEAEAALRIRAARFVRKFPKALEMVARGELHLTAICLLSPVVTERNIELLSLARHKSKAEVQQLIATRFPRPDARGSAASTASTTTRAAMLLGGESGAPPRRRPRRHPPRAPVRHRMHGHRQPS